MTRSIDRTVETVNNDGLEVPGGRTQHSRYATRWTVAAPSRDTVGRMTVMHDRVMPAAGHDKKNRCHGNAQARLRESWIVRRFRARKGARDASNCDDEKKLNAAGARMRRQWEACRPAESSERRMDCSPAGSPGNTSEPREAAVFGVSRSTVSRLCVKRRAEENRPATTS